MSAGAAMARALILLAAGLPLTASRAAGSVEIENEASLSGGRRSAHRCEIDWRPGAWRLRIERRVLTRGRIVWSGAASGPARGVVHRWAAGRIHVRAGDGIAGLASSPGGRPRARLATGSSGTFHLCKCFFRNVFLFLL